MSEPVELPGAENSSAVNAELGQNDASNTLVDGDSINNISNSGDDKDNGITGDIDANVVNDNIEETIEPSKETEAKKVNGEVVMQTKSENQSNQPSETMNDDDIIAPVLVAAVDPDTAIDNPISEEKDTQLLDVNVNEGRESVTGDAHVGVDVDVDVEMKEGTESEIPTTDSIPIPETVQPETNGDGTTSDDIPVEQVAAKNEIDDPADEDFKAEDEDGDGDGDNDTSDRMDVDMGGDEDNEMPDFGDANEQKQDSLSDTISNLQKVKKETSSITSKLNPSISVANLQRQTHTIVLPSYSSWFDLSKIHPIERESLPEYFQNSNKAKTPEIYMKYRNFMINCYRLNPNDYLSYTSVRRNLIGDAGAMLRVHKFLNKWGLINYQVHPETKPKQMEPPYTGDFIVDYDTPRGMFPFQSYKPPTTFPDLSKVKSILGSNLPANAAKHKLESTTTTATTTTATTTEDKEERKEISQNEGEANDDVKESDEQLQLEAPATKKQKIIKPDLDKNWTEESLKRLVDGVSKFKNDWYKIADHVGTGKTPTECIIRFLQLPIEDKFLEDNRELLGPLKYVPNLSFSPNDNPIMSTLAFLVSMIDSDAAVAASKRAIKVMDKKLEKKLNRFKEPVFEGTNEKEDLRTDPLEDIKDAAVTAFGIVGARSHMFATFEEREMNKSMVNIIQHQLKIVDMKMSKLNALEKEFEIQNKILEKKSNDLLEEKMSIFKYNNAATSKLQQAISLLDSSPELKDADVGKIKELISQSKDILYKPPRKQLNILEEGESTESNEETSENVKPISFDAPMLYRYWSG